MKRPGVSRPNPTVPQGQRAVPRVGPTTCASQQGLQELSPRAPRDSSDAGCAGQVPPPSRGDIPCASFHKPAHLNAGDSAHRKRGPPRKRPRVEAQHRHLTTPRAGGSGWNPARAWLSEGCPGGGRVATHPEAGIDATEEGKGIRG